jgi:hypothetical protein
MYEMHNEFYFIHKESSYDIFIQESIELWKKKGPMRELAIAENRQSSR